jgi:hypothetical protein
LKTLAILFLSTTSRTAARDIPPSKPIYISDRDLSLFLESRFFFLHFSSANSFSHIDTIMLFVSRKQYK